MISTLFLHISVNEHDMTVNIFNAKSIYYIISYIFFQRYCWDLISEYHLVYKYQLLLYWSKMFCGTHHLLRAIHICIYVIHFILLYIEAFPLSLVYALRQAVTKHVSMNKLQAYSIELFLLVQYTTENVNSVSAYCDRGELIGCITECLN